MWSDQPKSYGAKAWILGWLTVALVMLVLDLLWLGIVARPWYDEALGPLRRDPAYWPAALAFYGMYVTFLVWAAVLPSASVGLAAKRGAALGFFAYATYELTNWAVITDWPGSLVPLDVVWGVALTGGVCAAGRAASIKTPKP